MTEREQQEARRQGDLPAWDKQAVRAACLRRRQALHPVQVQALSRRVCGHLAARLAGWLAVRPPGTDPVVALYQPVRGEVDVRPLAEAVRALGGVPAFPRVRQDGWMAFYRVTPATDWSAGAFGIPEPRAADADLVPPERLAIAVVPGVAFGRDGSRLGYGGGYYDRFFREPRLLTLRVAAAYGFQVFDAVPADAHDVRVHALATEDGVTVCAAGWWGQADG